MLQVDLQWKAGWDGNRRVTFYLESERGPASEARGEPVAEESHQLGDALAPLGRSEESFVGIEILVEGQDVAEDGSAFQMFLNRKGQTNERSNTKRVL